MIEQWDLDKTLAWTIWRDRSLVDSIEGTKTFATISIYPPDQDRFTRRATTDDLLQALQEGTIKCRGSKNGKNDKEIIDPRLWLDLTFKHPPMKKSYAAPRAEGETTWHGISFIAEEVLKIFPQSHHNTIKSEPISLARLQLEYKKHIKKCQEAGQTPSWKDDQAAMKIALNKKPTDLQIKQIRRELAPEDWKLRGRRKAQ